MQPRSFTKRPVTIEAVQVTAESINSAAEWCNGAVQEDGGISIKTLEGTMLASMGDWIIKGVAGEFYPCKPDIFEKTYVETFKKDLPKSVLGIEGSAVVLDGDDGDVSKIIEWLFDGSTISEINSIPNLNMDVFNIKLSNGVETVIHSPGFKVKYRP